jgi:hypothetical protein
MTLHSLQLCIYSLLNVEKTKNNNFTCIKADRIIYIQASNYAPPFKRSRATTSEMKRLRVNLYAFDNLNFLMLIHTSLIYTYLATMKLPLPLSYSLLWNSRLLIFKVYQFKKMFNCVNHLWSTCPHPSSSLLDLVANKITIFHWAIIFHHIDGIFRTTNLYIEKNDQP